MSEPDARVVQSQAETRAAFENRALMYAYIFEELEKELGTERAAEIMKRAIHRRGREIGERYRPAAEAGDLGEVARLFVQGSPSNGALFEPGIDDPVEDGRTVLSMRACPLADAWRAAGYDEDRVDLLCDIASAVDYGTFEAAGLELRFLDRQACRGSDTCLLELRLREERR